MRTEYKEIIKEVFCDVLEKLAFMFGEPIPKEEIIQTDSRFVKAWMTFSGQFSGTLSIAVPEEMCTEIAANVLGMEAGEKVVQDSALDSLMEVLNVFCGHFLTAAVGPEPVFKLSVPDNKILSREEADAFMDDPDSLSFLIDERPALVLLSLEKGRE
jgi:hypothetical protein